MVGIRFKKKKSSKRNFQFNPITQIQGQNFAIAEKCPQLGNETSKLKTSKLRDSVFGLQTNIQFASLNKIVLTNKTFLEGDSN